MIFAYPLMLDVRDRLIVIIGGGAVAARKAAGLLNAGATKINIIAPEFRAAFHPSVQVRQKFYEPSDLEGAALVFAATDKPEVNTAVVADAKSRGIFVCRADFDEQNIGDFATPARLTDGEVTITVSAASPALAAAIRDSLAKTLDPRWSQMSLAVRALRPTILKDVSLDGIQRAILFRAFASDEAMQMLTNGGMDALRHWMMRKIQQVRFANP